MEASVLDLRKKMKDVMAAVSRHERITLTHRGKKKAIIVPFDDIDSAKQKVAAQKAFGMWADRDDMTDVSAYVENLRKPRKF
ncbi:MAG: type II toxin-antitoxin system prevent-host-death family antitoxin [Victivallaceae bacterium]